MDRPAYSKRIYALADVWQLWAEVGRSLQPRDWSAPTRCEGWDVACLYAHHSLYPLRLSGPAPAASEGEDRLAVLSAADILKGYNREGGAAYTMAAPVADRAKEDAARLGREELVTRFEGPAEQAIRALRQAEPDGLIPWYQTEGVTRFGEGIRIVLLEATVHLLDVLRALRRTPDLPRAALEETAGLLAELVPQVDFIEAATGRTPKSPLPVLR